MDKKKAQRDRSIVARREAFVREYIANDFKNAAEAYRKAYKCSATAAISSASRLLKDENIQEMMANELSAALKIARIPMETQVVSLWVKRAFYDPADIIDSKGNLLYSLDELSKRGLSVCVEGIEPKPDRRGNVHYIIKLADRDKALEMLQRYAQIIKPFDAKISEDDEESGVLTVSFVKSGHKKTDE